MDQRFRGANASQKQGYKDLIVGWLKTRLRFHGDPIKARRDRQEADDIEATLHENARDDIGRSAFETVMPESWKRKIGDLERHAEEQRAESARRQRAEHEARPRADVVLTFAGDVVGQIQTPLPALVTRPESAGEALTVELSPLEPIAAGGRSFRGIQFAIPAYAGPGAYDLATHYESTGGDWDPFWFQLGLESDEEPFYWVPDYGPASAVVELDEQTIRLRLPMQDAGSTRIDVDATVVLP
jgi:hypothetical protein